MIRCKVLQWRNAALDFPFPAGAARKPGCAAAGARPGAGAARQRRRRACVISPTTTRSRRWPASRDSVRRLWDVCQLPDFRKLSADEHVKLVRTIFLFLMSDEGRIPDDWMARQIARLDVTEGDVATLSGRLAQIRTYTYAAHRPGWTRDGAHWQGETRAVEDRLSDALHERLTQRFIDRRTSVLMKHLREDEFAIVDAWTKPAASRSAAKRSAGWMAFASRPIRARTKTAFMAAPCAPPRCEGWKARFLAARRALAAAPDSAITLSEHGKLWWDGAIVGQLAAGRLAARAADRAAGRSNCSRAHRAHRSQARLEAWLAARIEARLEPLLALARAAEAQAGSETALPGEARGIAHQLAENFGSLDRDGSERCRKNWDRVLRALKPFGVWFGRRTVYLPRLLRPDAAALLALLWGVWTKAGRNCRHRPRPALPLSPR